MKKFLGSLPARLIIGVIVGIALGLFSANLYIGETDVGSMIMQVVLTVKSLLGSLINFCVPLIIIGFIAPSITRLRSNASKMLGLALILAYASSVCAALMSMGAGYAIIPNLSIQSAAEGLRELPELLFDLEIAPIMTVIVRSDLLGAGRAGCHLDTRPYHYPGPGGVSADCTFHRDQGGHPHPALLHCRHLLWPGL